MFILKTVALKYPNSDRGLMKLFPRFAFIINKDN